MPDLAIIGAGIMGVNHGRVARTVKDFHTTVVCDPDEERAAALATSIGAKYTTDLDEAIAACDAAILATPSHTHGELGERILRAGRDLLVEKPIATTVDDAQRLIDAARAHDRVLMVGHVERFNPAVVELESLMDEPVAIEISRIGPFSPPGAGRRRARPDDPRHRPGPGAGRLRGGQAPLDHPGGALGRAGHRLRVAAVRERRGGEHHREPGQPEQDPPDRGDPARQHGHRRPVASAGRGAPHLALGVPLRGRREVPAERLRRDPVPVDTTASR